jgi:RNA polymerase sigma factor (sigma-70 family)
MLLAADRETRTGGDDRSFPSTCTWILRRLPARGTPEYEAAAGEFISAYWKPVYSLIRVARASSVEETKDLTQEFFLDAVLEGNLLQNYNPRRGGFRPFLKTYIRNFLRTSARTAGRKKRGGGVGSQRIDLSMVDPPDTSGLTPDEAFDRAWSEAVLLRARQLFESRLKAQGKEEYVRAFWLYELDPGNETRTYEQVAEKLGLSRDDVKNRLTRAREEYKRAVIAAVKEYVDSPEELAAELKDLFGI